MVFRDVGGAEEWLSQWAVSLAELIGVENGAGLLIGWSWVDPEGDWKRLEISRICSGYF